MHRLVYVSFLYNAEQEKSLNSMQQKNADLTSLSDRLGQQLGNVERKLEEALQRLRRVQEGSISDQLSDFNDDASTRTWNTEYTLDGLDDQSVVSNNTDISVVVDDSVASPVNLLMTSQDSGDRSHVSESTGRNSPMILFSSNMGRRMRVNVQGNASLSYASQSSGSETSGFIAGSSGYGQSPMQDLDRFLSDTDSESNAGSRPSSPAEQRPASPEPPYSMNNSSDDDDDANSIVQGSPASPVHSHYSLHTMSDSDAADAVRDILNITPPPRVPTDDNASLATSTPRHSYNMAHFTPTNSAGDQSDVDDLKGFTSSDDVSDEATSDREQNVQRFYSHDVLSDDGEFVNNSPSTTDDSDAESQNSSSRHSVALRTSHRGGFLSGGSDSDNSVSSNHDDKTECMSKIKGKTEDSDNESIGNKSNLTFSVSSRTSTNTEEHQSQQNDVQSLLDHFADEDVVLSDQSEDNKNYNINNDEHVAKSLDKLTEALEEMADEVDEMEAKMRKEGKKPEAPTSTQAYKSAQGDDKEVNDDESYVDVIGLVSGGNSDAKDPMEYSLSLRDHLASPPQKHSTNDSLILNTSESSIIEINSTVHPSNARTIPSKVKNEVPKREEKTVTSTGSRQSNRSRMSRQMARNIQLVSTSREQDRQIELLEEQYALKRENKNQDVQRYVSHVQSIMSGQDSENSREGHGGRDTNNDGNARQTVKRKYEQQPETTTRGTLPKKAKYETTDRPQRGMQSVGRNESSSADTSNERSTTHSLPLELTAMGSSHRRNNSLVGVPASNINLAGTSASGRKTGDKKHSWDPKKLNISLNVAINLDKAARGRGEAAGTSASLPMSDRQTAQLSRRNAPPVLKQRERSTQERVKFEGNRQHYQNRTNSSDRPSTSKSAANNMKTERLLGTVQSKSGGRYTMKAVTSTLSKPPPATIVSQAPKRPRRHAAPSTFSREPQSNCDTSSDEDVDWKPVGSEPSDVSISSSEIEEESKDYKLKLPIPTASLLEKYKDCDDSDDSWIPPV